MSNSFIHVNIILPSQERQSLTFNTKNVVFFMPAAGGDYTELVMTRGDFIVDMPYDEFKELSKLNDDHQSVTRITTWYNKSSFNP